MARSFVLGREALDRLAVPIGVIDAAILGPFPNPRILVFHGYTNGEGLRLDYPTDVTTIMDYGAHPDDYTFVFLRWASELDYFQYLADRTNGHVVFVPHDEKMATRKLLVEAATKLDQAPGIPVHHAAKFLGVDRRTISRMVAAGRLERLPGNRGIAIRSLIRLASATYVPPMTLNESEDLFGHLGH